MDAIEQEIDVDGYVELTFDTPGDEDGALFVLVESIEGEPLTDVAVITTGPADGEMPDFGGGMAAAPLPSEEHVGQVTVGAANAAEIRAFSGQIAASVRDIKVQVSSPGRQRVRVFVGWVKGWLPSTPCAKCRAIIKALLRLLRAAGGDFSLEELAAPIIEFLARSLGERVMEIIGDVLRGLRIVGRIMDRLATEICERLGHCP